LEEWSNTRLWYIQYLKLKESIFIQQEINTKVNGKIIKNMELVLLYITKGTYIIVDGNKYEGEWKEGVIDGEGTLYYANGNKYEGYWKNGQRSGKGNFIYQIQKAHFIMLTLMKNMKENGRTISNRVQELSTIPMAINTKAHGKTIRDMGKVTIK